MRRDREEKRSGQRDRDQGVTGEHEHLNQGETTEGLGLVEQITQGLARQGAKLVYPIAPGHLAQSRSDPPRPCASERSGLLNPSCPQLTPPRRRYPGPGFL